MKQTLRFVRELLRRHWLSFIFASILPAIVGLIAVAMTTIAMFKHYSDFLLDDYYEDVIEIEPKSDKYGTPTEGLGASLYLYSYYIGTETEKILNQYPVLGRQGSIRLIMAKRSNTGNTDYVGFIHAIDYEYWQNFPSKIYKGSGFTGTRNEILLDVSFIGCYDIGVEYEFEVCETNPLIVTEVLRVTGAVKATVVGFTRSAHSCLDFSHNEGVICLPYEEGAALGAYKKIEYRYIKIPIAELKKLYSSDFIWTLGRYKKYAARNEEQINEYAMLIFALSALIMLSILTDLCVNGTMLRCTERVAIRSGMRSKDISIGYGIKAFLQFAVSTVILLAVLLYYIHKSYTLFVLEYMWGGVIAMFLLGLISWALYSVGLFAAQRRKKKM